MCICFYFLLQQLVLSLMQRCQTVKTYNFFLLLYHVFIHTMFVHKIKTKHSNSHDTEIKIDIWKKCKQNCNKLFLFNSLYLQINKVFFNFIILSLLNNVAQGCSLKKVKNTIVLSIKSIYDQAVLPIHLVLPLWNEFSYLLFLAIFIEQNILQSYEWVLFRYTYCRKYKRFHWVSYWVLF